MSLSACSVVSYLLCAFARNYRCFLTQRREVKLKALRKTKFRHYRRAGGLRRLSDYGYNTRQLGRCDWWGEDTDRIEAECLRPKNTASKAVKEKAGLVGGPGLFYLIKPLKNRRCPIGALLRKNHLINPLLSLAVLCSLIVPTRPVASGLSLELRRESVCGDD